MPAENSLLNYGFTDETVILRCRICNSPVHRYGYARLLGKDVKYGYCRIYTHGVSVSKIIP